jgi:hypothetical protein
VVAVENCSVVFQGAVGAFCASTAPAASTGSSSSIGHSPEGQIAPHLFEALSPRVIRSGGATARCRHWWRGGDRPFGDGPRHRRCRARGNFRPAHGTVAIPNLDPAGHVLGDHHGAARRRLSALSLQLQESIVVAHDPVIRHGALLFQPKHRVEPHAARPDHVIVIRRGGRPRKARCTPPNTWPPETRSRARDPRSLCDGAFSRGDPAASHDSVRCGPSPAANSRG